MSLEMKLENPSEKHLSPEEELVVLLDTMGIEDSRAKDKLIEYAKQGEVEVERYIAEHTEDAGNANTAEVIRGFMMAKLYAKTEKYKEYALECLYDLMDGMQHVSSVLQEEIKTLGKQLQEELGM